MEFNESSRERKFHPMELLFPGVKVLWNEFFGTKVPAFESATTLMRQAIGNLPPPTQSRSTRTLQERLLVLRTRTTTMTDTCCNMMTVYAATVAVPTVIPVIVFTYGGFPFYRFPFYRFPFLPFPNLPLPNFPFPFLPFPF